MNGRQGSKFMTQDTKWSNLSQARAVENFTARLGTLTFPRIARDGPASPNEARRAVQRGLRMAFDFVPTRRSGLRSGRQSVTERLAPALSGQAS